jgi:acetyl/propionyl-CoA carboxylase alpha subunit
VGGIKTTIPFFCEILADGDFRRGEIDTGFIPRWFARRESQKTGAFSAEDEAVAVLAAGLHFLKRGGSPVKAPEHNGSAWKTSGRRSMLRNA